MTVKSRRGGQAAAKTKETLPRGVSRRGSNYRVSVMVDGVRQTATCDTAQEAAAKVDAIRRGMVEEALRTEPAWTIATAAARYRDEHQVPTGLSAKSIELFQCRARSLTDFFGTATPLDKIGAADLVRFRAYSISEAGLSPRTVRLDLTILAAYMRHARKMGGMISPMPEMPSVKIKASPPRFLSRDQEIALIDYFRAVGDTDMEELVAVMVDTGLRIDVEALSVPWSAFHLKGRAEARRVTVTGKGGVTRSLPVTARVAEIIRRRWSVARPHQEGPFTDLTYKGALRAWGRARTHLGYEDDKGFTPHICRHTYCTRLVSGGVDLVTVRDLAGHSDIKTTMVYAHAVPKGREQALAALAQGDV